MYVCGYINDEACSFYVTEQNRKRMRIPNDYSKIKAMILSAWFRMCGSVQRLDSAAGTSARSCSCGLLLAAMCFCTCCSHFHRDLGLEV